jgi:hypothetical protein
MKRLVQPTGLFCLLGLIACQCLAQELLLAGSRRGAPGNPLVQTFLSANKQYRLTLDQFNGPVGVAVPTDLMATVAKMSGTNSEIIWSRKIKARPVQFIMDFDLAISDDGQFFAVTGQSGRSLLICPKEAGPWEFTSSADISRQMIPKSIFDTTEIFGTGKRDLPPSFPQESYFRSWPEILFRLDKVDGENVVAFWWRDENLWEASRASDGKKVPFKKELQDRWNAETRREIVETLEKALNAKALKKMGKLPKAFESIATNLVPEVKFGEIRETQYEFLALLRNPEDRKWIEALFEQKVEENPRRYYRSFFHQRRESDSFCESIDEGRVLGDWFLAVWDGKIKKKQQFMRNSFEAQISPLYFLGRVEGTVHLSTPFHPRRGIQTGPIRLQLLPTDNSKMRETADYRGGIYLATRSGGLPEQRPPVTQIQFSFGTVLPGKYQLKVIWDKRRPFTDEQKPGPGDYESALSKPFDVAAGQTISNLVLHCTNRASLPGAENYYAADDLKARLIK